jgi:hypothetical protein
VYQTFGTPPRRVKEGQPQTREAGNVFTLRSRGEVPLSESAQPLIRLAGQLQLINDSQTIDPGRKFRTATGLAYQSKSFHNLDRNSPYSYRHEIRVTDLARTTWETYGTSTVFSESFGHELRSRLKGAQDDVCTKVLRTPLDAPAVVYLLQHRLYSEFVKVGYTTGSPDLRANNYSDGQWTVVGEFRTQGKQDAQAKEELVHPTAELLFSGK